MLVNVDKLALVAFSGFFFVALRCDASRCEAKCRPRAGSHACAAVATNELLYTCGKYSTTNV
jgi:hypothetical protein